MDNDEESERDRSSIKFARAVASGLGERPKTLPYQFLYDEEGSRLFDAICHVREYYIPAAEREILRTHAAEIVARLPTGSDLVELGCGTAVKTRIIIEAILKNQGFLRYYPIDISQDALTSASALSREYSGVEVTNVDGEFAEGLRRLGQLSGAERPKLVLFLGSSLGNYDPPAAAELLKRLHRSMVAHDRMLIGIDLRKHRAVLEAAYDDSSGMTARFNLNFLGRINRELGGHFDLETFRHRAVFNEDAGRVEMHLVSMVSQRVAIDLLKLEVSFEAGETIHTESSYKYIPAEFEALAIATGFRVEQQWFDSRHLFSSVLLGTA